MAEVMAGPRMSDRGLTPRQREIVEYLSRPGATQASVAEDLELAEQTIKNHLQAAYRTFGVRTFGQLIAALGRPEVRTPVR